MFSSLIKIRKSSNFPHFGRIRHLAIKPIRSSSIGDNKHKQAAAWNP